MKQKLLIAWMLSFIFICFSSLSANTKKLTIFVSIKPQEYFVKRITGDRVNVYTLLPPGNTPETFAPSARQMAALSNAQLYFRIGVPYEDAILPKIESRMKSLKVIDTRKGIKLLDMRRHQFVNLIPQEKDSEDLHEEEEGRDPHIWLSPLLVKIQAHTILDALTDIDPVNKQFYVDNYKKFIDDLDKLNKELTKVLAPEKGKTLMVFHPAWGYFADNYGLKQQAIEIEGKSPSARQLAVIIDKAKKEKIKVIFVQPQISPALVSKIAKSINATVVPIDPLAYDYIKNMKSIADIVAKSLNKQKN